MCVLLACRALCYIIPGSVGCPWPIIYSSQGGEWVPCQEKEHSNPSSIQQSGCGLRWPHIALHHLPSSLKHYIRLQCTGPCRILRSVLLSAAVIGVHPVLIIEVRWRYITKQNKEKILKLCLRKCSPYHAVFSDLIKEEKNCTGKFSD